MLPLCFFEQIYEKRRAHYGGQDSDGDLRGRKATRDTVDYYHERRSERRGNGDQAVIVVADEHSADMRHYQSHPADSARNAHRACRDQSRAADYQKLVKVDVDAEDSGFLVAHGKHVDFPAAQKNQRHSEEYGNERPKMRIVDGSEASHEPERYFGKLAVRIRDVFHDRNKRPEQARDHHAAEYQTRGGRSAAHSACQIGEHYRRERETEREKVCENSAAKEYYRKARAESRAV